MKAWELRWNAYWFFKIRSRIQIRQKRGISAAKSNNLFPKSNKILERVGCVKLKFECKIRYKIEKQRHYIIQDSFRKWVEKNTIDFSKIQCQWQRTKIYVAYSRSKD